MACAYHGYIRHGATASSDCLDLVTDDPLIRIDVGGASLGILHSSEYTN